MHGVGYKPLFAALQSLRLGVEHHIDVVSEQMNPDPAFPTTPYPNPEEVGALDLAKRVRKHPSQIIIANDPDADRFCAMVGDQTMLGNQLGILFADFMLKKYQKLGNGMKRQDSYR